MQNISARCKGGIHLSKATPKRLNPRTHISAWCKRGMPCGAGAAAGLCGHDRCGPDFCAGTHRVRCVTLNPFPAAAELALCWQVLLVGYAATLAAGLTFVLVPTVPGACKSAVTCAHVAKLGDAVWRVDRSYRCLHLLAHATVEVQDAARELSGCFSVCLVASFMHTCWQGCRFDMGLALHTDQMLQSLRHCWFS